MPRVARIVVPEVTHHITQRGNNQQDIFFVDDDRKVYLELLKKQSDKFALEVLGYCLMTNHVHIIATPANEHSLAKAIGRTHLLYTQYINRMHRRSGHLWQNRFFSCPLGPDYFWMALRYAELNPVRAKMVDYAWDYLWSSASVHTGKFDGTGMINLRKWRQMAIGLNWKEILTQDEDEKQIRSVRTHTHTGRPLATDSFISKIEHYLGRRVRPLPLGRPREIGDSYLLLKWRAVQRSAFSFFLLSLVN